jgi:hypothetical protein
MKWFVWRDRSGRCVSFYFDGPTFQLKPLLCLISSSYCRFNLALKYLEEGAKKAVHIPECAPLLAGYYCNYSEALFHSGKEEQSLDIAKRAVELARKNKDTAVLEYAQRFLKDLQRDYNKKMGKRSSWW